MKEKSLERVFKIAEYTAMTKEARKEYEESLKNYNDLQNTLETSEREGYEKGIQELTPLLEEAKAREEEAKAREEEERKLKDEAKAREEDAKSSLRSIIQKLISKGFSIEDIADDLGKSVDEVNVIIEK